MGGPLRAGRHERELRPLGQLRMGEEPKRGQARAVAPQTAGEALPPPRLAGEPLLGGMDVPEGGRCGVSQDPRRAFIAGAEWWAGHERQPLSAHAESEAERYFPEGRMDHPEGVYGRRPPEGTWPVTYLGRAFVKGAKWQEYSATGATMWASDRDRAEQEALRRFPLGESSGAA